MINNPHKIDPKADYATALDYMRHPGSALIVTSPFNYQHNDTGTYPR